ncbi:zeta toxin family protein [Streptomyces sp. NPDC057910]|uniref:zeta toxin family protein n=1 Tax=Streptomyces sp. NPDC057910 TaxID=3346278 RepID=UPI0036ED8B8E
MDDRAAAPVVLAEGEYQEILGTLILPERPRGAVRLERPVVVFVAGQGGSGRSLVMDLVCVALARRGGAVRVDRDAYKDVHPHYPGFLAKDVRTAGVCVRRETYQWQAEVEAHARAARYDVVVEVLSRCRWRDRLTARQGVPGPGVAWFRPWRAGRWRG